MDTDCPAVIPPETLLSAYARGLFPMADSETGELGWYTANPRGIIDLEAFHIPRRLARSLRTHPFEIRVDTAFREVMEGCADREDTWINAAILDSNELLFELGCAHCVEAWREGQLVGGIYGVAMRGAFFGESMFHRATNASKAVLVALVDRLRDRGYRLFDIQMVTPTTAQFGARLISRRQYERLLAEALALDCQFG